MRHYGTKRGGVEFEYLMIVVDRLVRYYGMERAIEMLGLILRALAVGIESETVVANFIPRPDDSEDEDDLIDPPDQARPGSEATEAYALRTRYRGVLEDCEG